MFFISLLLLILFISACLIVTNILNRADLITVGRHCVLPAFKQCDGGQPSKRGDKGVKIPLSFATDQDTYINYILS